LFKTGSVPGIPAQTGHTLTFGSAFVVSTMAQEQNILLAVASSAWTSNPMTGSYFMMGLILPLPGVLTPGTALPAFYTWFCLNLIKSLHTEQNNRGNRCAVFSRWR
jgi:hypothetical protein